MGRLDKIKLWYECRKSGRKEEYENYKNALERNRSDINRFKGYISDATQKFENIKRKFSEGSKEYVEAKYEVFRWQHSLDEAELSMKFIRPNSQEDIDYRNYQCENFVEQLQSVISPNLDLRFHGTPIYFAEQIIRSGSISSTADRYDGYIKSTDMKGEISASTVESLGRTINFFSDMPAYHRNLPAGCIFALLPKDKEDAEYGHDLMHSVDFRKNPEQLFGVFTTPENTEQVKGWMKESGLNPESVYTFEGFLEAVKTKSQTIDEASRNSDSENLPNNDLSMGIDENTPINMNSLVKKALKGGVIESEIDGVDNLNNKEQIDRNNNEQEKN